MSEYSEDGVIIVGAGIGGLSLSIALSRQGHQPVVLERASQIGSVGSGITLFPNAIGGLRFLGVADDVRAAGAVSTFSAIFTSNGRCLAKVPAAVLDGTVAVHRSDLHSVLLDKAGRLGVEVQLGAEVTSVEQTDQGVTVEMADGSRRRGQLIVGADGVWSVTRGSVAAGTATYGGYTVWRGVSPVTIAPGHITESWGTGERFGLVDIGSKTYWFGTANTPEGAADRPDDRKSDVLRRFADWHLDIPTILEATPDGSILHNDVYYLESLPRWSHGRVVLLGDAAHATTPGIGQGAGQAIEDAVVLASQIGDPHILSELGGLRERLARYESTRRPRAELTLKLSRRADRAAQLDNPFAVRLRNLVVAVTPTRLQVAEMDRIIQPQPPPDDLMAPDRRFGSASSTAAVVASMRAEMDRPSSPSGDTEAAHRLAQTLQVPLRTRRAPVMRPYVEGRTRFFDAAVEEASSKTGQIAIIGAGYDDRSMRFRAPGVTFIEVDHPSTQRDKRARLDQLGIDSSDIRFVPVDLAVEAIDDALRDLVDTRRPVTFICEAVIPYLPYERVWNLLAGLRGLCSAVGSLYLDPPLLPDGYLGRALFPFVKLATRMRGEPLRTVLHNSDMNRLLAETGWAEQERRTGRELGMTGPAARSVYLHVGPAAQQ